MSSDDKKTVHPEAGKIHMYQSQDGTGVDVERDDRWETVHRRVLKDENGAVVGKVMQIDRKGLLDPHGGSLQTVELTTTESETHQHGEDRKGVTTTKHITRGHNDGTVGTLVEQETRIDVTRANGEKVHEFYEKDYAIGEDGKARLVGAKQRTTDDPAEPRTKPHYAEQPHIVQHTGVSVDTQKDGHTQTVILPNGHRETIQHHAVKDENGAKIGEVTEARVNILQQHEGGLQTGELTTTQYKIHGHGQEIVEGKTTTKNINLQRGDGTGGKMVEKETHIREIDANGKETDKYFEKDYAIGKDGKALLVGAKERVTSYPTEHHSVTPHVAEQHNEHHSAEQPHTALYTGTMSPVEKAHHEAMKVVLASGKQYPAEHCTTNALPAPDAAVSPKGPAAPSHTH